MCSDVGGELQAGVVVSPHDYTLGKKGDWVDLVKADSQVGHGVANLLQRYLSEVVGQLLVGSGRGANQR